MLVERKHNSKCTRTILSISQTKKSIVEQQINILNTYLPTILCELISSYEYHYFPKFLRKIEGYSNWCSFIIDPLANCITSICTNDMLKIWNPLTGTCDTNVALSSHNWYIRINKEELNSFAILSNKTNEETLRIVTGSSHGRLRIFKIEETVKCYVSFRGHYDAITCLTKYPDGRMVTGSNDHTLKIWEFEKDTISNCTFFGHNDCVNCIAICSDGRIVSGSSDKTLKIWNVQTKMCDITLTGHDDSVTCLAVYFDGRIISGSRDGTLKIWNTDTGKCDATFKGHLGGINCIAISPDGKIISGSNDRTLKIWDAQTGTSSRRARSSGQQSNCLSSKDPEGKCYTLIGHNAAVTHVAILNDGQIVSGSYNDDTLILWS
jgi:WD40 repeat protein